MNRIERANDFQRRQAIIRDLFDGYSQALLEYAIFMDEWRKRNQKREAA